VLAKSAFAIAVLKASVRDDNTEINVHETDEDDSFVIYRLKKTFLEKQVEQSKNS
jgi:hypothetical protein